MRRFLGELPRRLFLLVMLLGSSLIAMSSLEYFDFATLPPFAIEKLPLRFEALFLASLRVHVASALASLPLCLLLMTRTLHRWPAWHRWLGRVAGVLVLFALVPSGSVLAFDAKGGALVTAGFLLSGAIVAIATVLGIRAARCRDFAVHRRALRHVVAQMSVAVTSRALIIGFDVIGMDPNVSYALALWGPVIASSVAAELLTSRSLRRLSRLSTFIERIRREILLLSRLVRARPVATRPVTRLGR